MPSVAYASGNLGKVLLWSTTELTLLFILTEVAGIAPSIAGSLLALTLLADILIDLLAGRIAASTSAKGLTYGALVAFATPVCALGFALLFALPAAGMVSLPLLAAALLLFRAGYGFVDVAHSAMLPSVSPDSRTRGRVAGYRSFFSAVAAVIVTLVMAPAAAAAAQIGDAREIARLGAAAALLFLLCMAVVVWSDRARRCVSRSLARQPGAASPPLLPRLRGPMLRLLAIGVLAGSAIPMLGRCFLYLATYVFQDPDRAGVLLTAAVAGQFLGIPIWILAIQRFEKRHMLALAGVATSLAVAAFALAPAALQPWAAAWVGACAVGILMIPWALLADVVDLDHARDGDRREPQSFAAYLVALKGGGGVGTLALGWVLGLAGLGSTNPDPTAIRVALQWAAFAPPILGGLAVAVLARQLGISHADHALAVQRATMADAQRPG